MFGTINKLQRWATTVLTQGDGEPPRVAVVRDRESCERWLAEAPLADPTSASAALDRLLDELHDSELSGARYYGILEQLRPSILLVQLQILQQVSGRGVPLPPAQKQAFDVVQKLWEQLARGYIRAFEEANAGDESIDRRKLVARALEALSGLILGHYLARQALPAAAWERLHAMWKRLERCERRGGAPEESGSGEPTAADIYVFNVLMHLAEPYRLTTRQLSLARAWTIRWARKVQLTDRIAEGSIGVDLDSTAAPGLVRPNQEARALDLARLEASLMKRLRALRRGTPAKTLGLGADCTDAEAAELLGILYRRWCGTGTRAPRPAPSWENSRIAVGAARIIRVQPAVSVSGAPRWEYSGRGRDSPNTFGSVSLDDASPGDARYESWQLAQTGEESLELLRIDSGEAVSQGSLLAIRRLNRAKDTGRIALAVVDWVLEESHGAVRAGVTLLPGRIERIEVTRLDEHVHDGRARGFAMLLERDDGLRDLVVESGGIEAGERIEFDLRQHCERVRVGALTTRGGDFRVYGLK